MKQIDLDPTVNLPGIAREKKIEIVSIEVILISFGIMFNRDLQMKWSQEDEIPALVDVNSDQKSVDSMEVVPGYSTPREWNPVVMGIHRHDSFADEKSEGFKLFHFNGLEGHGRPAKLTPFVLFKRSASNTVGQSIALSGAGGGESQFANSHMEEILRTKWPGCRVDWMGNAVPKLN